MWGTLACPTGVAPATTLSPGQHLRCALRGLADRGTMTQPPGPPGAGAARWVPVSRAEDRAGHHAPAGDHGRADRAAARGRPGVPGRAGTDEPLRLPAGAGGAR